MDIQNLKQQATEIIYQTGQYIRNAINHKHTIEVKSVHNYVTEIDKNAEKMLVDGLKKILPHSGFLTEEQTVEQNTAEYRWIVDPLDGTTNFIHGFFPVAISVALLKEDKIILGIVYEIGQDEMFYAIEGKGAYLNNEQIKVSDQANFENSLLATGFPFHDYKNIDAYTEVLKYFMLHTSGIRRLGSAATDLVYTAAGRFDGFYEYSLNPWDVAAGSLIVKEAGGIISDFSGGNNWLFGREIIAANPLIYNEILKVIQNKMSVN